jgi:CRP/FNR family transcriptional regulator, cyclic AMP receptor protein
LTQCVIVVSPSRVEGRVTDRRKPASGPRDFLALLSEQDRAALESLARRASFSPATVLMHEGLYPESVLVVLDGLVKVTCVTASGRESILGFCGSGELIGELAVIDEQPHGSTVITIGPVRAMVVSSRTFRAFVEERPGAAIAILKMLGDRFRDADRRLVEFGAGDALGRVASRLMELCAAYGEESERGVKIALHLSQEELAGWAGCSTKAVVNSLQTLRRLGLVETGRRQLTIVDVEGLRSRASGMPV